MNGISVWNHFNYSLFIVIPGALDKTKKMGKTNKSKTTKTKARASSSKSRTSRNKITGKTESIEYDSDGYSTPGETTKAKTKGSASDGYTTPKETTKAKIKGSASSSKSHTSKSTTASVNKVVQSMELESDVEDVNTGGDDFDMVALDWRDIEAIRSGVSVIKPKWNYNDIKSMTTTELHTVLFDSMDAKTFKECYMALSVSGGVFCTGLGYHEIKERQKSWKSMGKSSRSNEIRSLLKELQKQSVHENRIKGSIKDTKSSSRSVASTAGLSESSSEQPSDVESEAPESSSSVEIVDNPSDGEKGKKNTRKQSKCDDNRVDEPKASPPKKIKVEPGTQGSYEDSTDDDTNKRPQKPRSRNPYVGTKARGKTGKEASPEKTEIRTLTANDDDSDDPLSGIDLSTSFLQSNSRRGKKMTIIVSHPFFCAIRGRSDKLLVVVFFVNQPMLWYLKPDFIMMNLSHIQQKRAFLKGDVDWEMKWKDTFHDFQARVPYTREDTLVRNTKGKTTSHFSFVLEMDASDDVSTVVQEAMATIGSIFKYRPGKTNCGRLFLDFLRMYGQQKLHDHLVESMGNKDEKVAADSIAKEMDTHLSRGMLTYEWNCTLDKIWPNFEIKQFLLEYVGVQKWEDMDSEEKKKVYRAYDEDSPQVLPEWEKMVKLSWN